MFYFVRHVTKKLFSPKYLIYTNTLTAGTLLALGDAIQQMRERRAAGLLKAKVKAASNDERIVPVHQNGMIHVTTTEWDWGRTGLYLYTFHIRN